VIFICGNQDSRLVKLLKLTKMSEVFFVERMSTNFTFLVRHFDWSENSGEGKIRKIQKAFARQGLGLKA